jgi:hypothetical protein
LPATLVALLAVVAAVDVLLACQPALLTSLSDAWRSAVPMRMVRAPLDQVLVATFAVASVVVTSAVLLAFVRAVRVAPHTSLAPAWVSLCTLSMITVEGPLPVSPVLFAGVNALLVVGAGVSLHSGSRIGTVGGWLLVISPLALFGASYADPATAPLPFGHGALVFLIGLVLSAVGVSLIAFMRKPDPAVREVEGLDDINVVAELFAQVERAERSEARAAELERQLRSYKTR